MAGLMDDMRQKLIRQAKERAAASARESTTRDASESTSAHTSDPTVMYTHTSEHTSSSTQNTTYTHTHTPAYTSPYTSAYTPDDAPTPRIIMKRTQIYLRPDQIAWLDKKAEQSGKGVTRSDWVRYAVDELMRRDVDV